MGLSERSKALRATRIGASAVACLMPCGHPFTTPAKEYARIVHGVTGPTRPIMEMGQLMEGSIFWLGRQLMRDRGLWVRSNSRSIARPRYTATPDGYCACGGVIEVKNVSSYAAEWWRDDATPEHYIVQVQLQMYASGRDHCHVWALLAGTQFAERRIDADPDYQMRIVAAIDDFFTRHVEPKVPPLTDDSTLLLTFNHPEGTAVADGALLDIGDAVATASRQKADALRSYDIARDMLAGIMARNDIKELDGPDWNAKAAPAHKDAPDGEWRLTFRNKSTRNQNR